MGLFKSKKARSVNEIVATFNDTIKELNNRAADMDKEVEVHKAVIIASTDRIGVVEAEAELARKIAANFSNMVK